jgi:hypothetical protein
MQVALITDNTWLDEELGQFKHLIVGMLDENVRVVQVVPEGTDDEYLSAFGQKLFYGHFGRLPLRRWFLKKITPKLNEMNVTLLHALNSRCWRGSADMARKLDLPLVLSLASGTELDLAAKLHKQEPTLRIGWLAATEPLARGLRDRIGPETAVQTVRIGVHLPEKPNFEIHPPQEHIPCLIVTGNGTFDAAYDHLFLGLAHVIAKHHQLQVFLDVQGHYQHRFWNAAKKRSLLGNVSFVPHRLGHRDLMLHADMLVAPQATGDARSLMLQAMAQGIPIVAQIDPWLDYLIDNQTARLIDKPDALQWCDTICELLDDRLLMQHISRRSREWIDEHHVPAEQVQEIMSFYRKISGESIPFPEQPG